MSPRELFHKAWTECNSLLLRSVLRDFPDVLASQNHLQEYLFSAARQGNVEVVEVLLDFGMDVNYSSDFGGDRPIASCLVNPSLDLIHCMVRHGAELNYAVKNSHVHSPPLLRAILANQLEITTFLVESGSLINAGNLRGTSPLSIALKLGRAEIADFLRSRGGLETHELPGYVLPHPSLAYVENTLGNAQRVSWLPDGSNSLYAVWHEDHFGLFTVGMSDRVMRVPPGEERFRHAELMLHLDPEVWESDPEEWQNPEGCWPIDWMLKLAEWPFEDDSWLGGKVTVIANGEPPAPLSDFTEMTCWLLRYEKSPLQSFDLPNGKQGLFYTPMPIHTLERDYERQHGIVRLLQSFAKRNTPEVLVADRPSAVGE